MTLWQCGQVCVGGPGGGIVRLNNKNGKAKTPKKKVAPTHGHGSRFLAPAIMMTRVHKKQQKKKKPTNVAKKSPFELTPIATAAAMNA